MSALSRPFRLLYLAISYTLLFALSRPFLLYCVLSPLLSFCTVCSLPSFPSVLCALSRPFLLYCVLSTVLFFSWLILPVLSISCLLSPVLSVSCLPLLLLFALVRSHLSSDSFCSVSAVVQFAYSGLSFKFVVRLFPWYDLLSPRLPDQIDLVS